MPARVDQETLLTRIAELERRLRALESSPQAPNRSQRGGTFTLIPADGAPAQLLKFGTFTDADGNSQYGLAIYDSNGFIVMATDEGDPGLVMPAMVTQMVNPTPTVVTSGTFATYAECKLPLLVHDTIYFEAAFQTDVGTTAEVRVRETNGGSTFGPITVGSGANGNVIFSWLHNRTIGWNTLAVNVSNYQTFLQYDVRRASGAGNVYVYPPRSLIVANHRFVNGESAGSPLSFV